MAPSNYIARGQLPITGTVLQAVGIASIWSSDTNYSQAIARIADADTAGTVAFRTPNVSSPSARYIAICRV